MPWEQLATYLSYSIMVVGGWFLKALWSAVRELQIDLSKLREEIGKDYMPRIEIKDVFDSILHEIRDVKNEIKAHEAREYGWHSQTVSEIHAHYNKSK